MKKNIIIAISCIVTCLFVFSCNKEKKDYRYKWCGEYTCLVIIEYPGFREDDSPPFTISDPHTDTIKTDFKVQVSTFSDSTILIVDNNDGLLYSCVISPEGKDGGRFIFPAKDSLFFSISRHWAHQSILTIKYCGKKIKNKL
ncbi:MAG: hypothetical protein LBV69_11625 [Bacteroidales bacterium]|jgi:hypothetical protein|nr:hypothetical protein [Bacteroidales bacterium]